jgi:hypothetical protein
VDLAELDLIRRHIRSSHHGMNSRQSSPNMNGFVMYVVSAEFQAMNLVEV